MAVFLFFQMPYLTPAPNTHLARWAAATAIIVFLLVAAGAIVRTTGAGMGCPDWPRCFGLWVPPTHASQLPADYMLRYATQHVVVEPFNAVKTWTEYLNRLLGALTGVFAFVTAIIAFNSYRKWQDKPVFWLALIALILIAFEAWLGKRVVDTNLDQLKVTTHLVVALLIASIYVVMVLRARRLHNTLAFGGSIARTLRVLLPVVALAFLCQIALGTGVRETIDHGILRYGPERMPDWQRFTDGRFLWHKTLALAVFAGSVACWFYARKYLMGTVFYTLLTVAAGATALQIFSGVILINFALPAAIRVLHLLLSTVALTGLLAAYYVFLQRRPINEYQH